MGRTIEQIIKLQNSVIFGLWVVKVSKIVLYLTQAFIISSVNMIFHTKLKDLVWTQPALFVLKQPLILEKETFYTFITNLRDKKSFELTKCRKKPILFCDRTLKKEIFFYRKDRLKIANLFGQNLIYHPLVANEIPEKFPRIKMLAQFPIWCAPPNDDIFSSQM